MILLLSAFYGGGNLNTIEKLSMHPKSQTWSKLKPGRVEHPCFFHKSMDSGLNVPVRERKFTSLPI